MNTLEQLSNRKLILISLLCCIFVIYPDIVWLHWELDNKYDVWKWQELVIFAFRYAYYSIAIFVILKLNIKNIHTESFIKRFGYSFLIGGVVYLLYVFIYVMIDMQLYDLDDLERHKKEVFIDIRIVQLSSIVLFQFIVITMLTALIAHLRLMHLKHRKKELEIERLKRENLQNQYDALTNQINPHFFFNSLNGLASLVRRKDEKVTLTYINKLSDVFRYILQSNKKGLVTLAEELQFVEAFRYLMEVRFANKLNYRIEVDEKYLSHMLPILSILPLLENVVVHNCIDSECKMEVSISVSPDNELVVSNPVYPKLMPPESNGTGLKNLDSRFMLLLGKPIRKEQTESEYRVYLPLKTKPTHENTNS